MNIGNTLYAWRNRITSSNIFHQAMLMRYRWFVFFRYGIHDPFLNVEFETTSYCNRRCPYCPVSKIYRGHNKMELTVFQTIVKQLSEMQYAGYIRLHFYNEPLLDTRLPSLIRYCHKRAPYALIQIYTNGDYLTKSLFTILIRAGVSHIILTDHSGMNTKRVMSFLQNNPNRNKISIYSIQPNDSALFNRGGLVDVPIVIKMKTCSLAADYLTLDYNGNVVLCCNDMRSSMIFGNVKDSRIVDIWKRNGFSILRHQLKKGVCTLPICKRCMGITRK